MSATHSSPDPFKRHLTRFRGINYRLKADGSKSYYVYAQGRQHAVQGGEREAVTRQAELRGKVAKGERIAPANVKFAETAEQWLASKVKIRSKTRTDHRRALDLVLLPSFGHLKLARVDANMIAGLIQGLALEGLHHVDPTRPVRPLGASQISNYVTKPLSGVLKHALRRGLTGSNPVALLTPDERPHDADKARPDSVVKRNRRHATLMRARAILRSSASPVSYVTFSDTRAGRVRCLLECWVSSLASCCNGRRSY